MVVLLNEAAVEKVADRNYALSQEWSAHRFASSSGEGAKVSFSSFNSSRSGVARQCVGRAWTRCSYLCMPPSLEHGDPCWRPDLAPCCGSTPELQGLSRYKLPTFSAWGAVRCPAQG